MFDGFTVRKKEKQTSTPGRTLLQLCQDQYWFFRFCPNSELLS